MEVPLELFKMTLKSANLLHEYKGLCWFLNAHQTVILGLQNIFVYLQSMVEMKVVSKFKHVV